MISRGEKFFDVAFGLLCSTAVVLGFVIGIGWTYPAWWALPRLMVGMAVLMAPLGAVFDFLMYRSVKSAFTAMALMVIAAIVLPIASALLGAGVAWFFTAPPLE